MEAFIQTHSIEVMVGLIVFSFAVMLSMLG